MALGAEASLKRVTMKDLASDLIWHGLAESSKTLAEHATQDFVDHNLVTRLNVQEARKPFIQEAKISNNQMIKSPCVQKSVPPGEVGVVNSSSQKRKRLMPRIDSCIEIQQKIADLWERGELTREQIADEIGYPRSTVKNWIKIQIASGKLPIRDQDESSEKDINHRDQLTLLVDLILKLNNQIISTSPDQNVTTIQRQIDATDSQIDRLVYELYGLTEEDIKIVEGASGTANEG